MAFSKTSFFILMLKIVVQIFVFILAILFDIFLLLQLKIF